MLDALPCLELGVDLGGSGGCRQEALVSTRGTY